MTLIAALVAVVGGWLLGWRLGARRRAWVPASFVAVAVIALWIVSEYVTDWSVVWAPWREYFYFERVPLVLAVFVLLAICRRNVERPLLRPLVVAVGLVFAVHSVLGISGHWVFSPLVGRLDASEDTLQPISQTSGWSCSAAAGATLLRLHGIHTSEREVARLAGTSPIEGTSRGGLCRAIDILGADKGLRPRLRVGLEPTQIDEIAVPCVFAYKLYTTVWHSAVLVETEGDTFQIEDPLMGSMTWTREEFLSKWIGEVTEILRDEPGA